MIFIFLRIDRKYLFSERGNIYFKIFKYVYELYIDANIHQTKHGIFNQFV